MKRQYVFIFILALFSGFMPSTRAQNQASSTENNRRIVRKVDPEYPAMAKRMNLAGTVKIVAMVAPDGTVKNVEPVGGSPVLLKAAETAISQWKFAPGGESKETVEIHFTP